MGQGVRVDLDAAGTVAVLAGAIDLWYGVYAANLLASSGVSMTTRSSSS